ncbi:MAG: sigma-70 family RNA polymerase sigma factor, partial [Bacteroidales bacterium]|nr:sigma-70 family RNA polymerase sigma factor [Bacteroidales bacterium]
MLNNAEIASTMLKERRNLTAYIVSIVNNYQAAEDLYQDVCVKAISTKATFENQTNLIRWSRTTSRNTAIDYLRKHRRRVIVFSHELLDTLEGEWPDHIHQDPSDRLEALSACMKNLTPRNNELIRLRYGKALSGIEIAGIMERKV